MLKLDDPTILDSVYKLFVTCRHLGRMLPTIPEAPEGSISKYAFYLASLKSGGEPKVVRCVVKGWGAEQHQSVVSAAIEASGEPTDCDSTAVITDYGLVNSAELRVSVFVRRYKLNASFAFQATGDSISYIQSDEEAEQDILRLIGGWAASTKARPPRKKFLGLF
ncbi:MAG: hypothetical protein KF892_23865 [Rhizobacter sp.]|nr:hypothetical protein [Rhizobacter sp.]